MKATLGSRLALGVKMTMLEQKTILDEWRKSKESAKRVAVRLYQCADHFAMTPRDMKAFPHLLDRYELDTADVNTATITLANFLDQNHGAIIDDVVTQINHMAALVERQKKVAPAKPVLIYGMPPLAIVEWMGFEQWTADNSARVIRELGAELTDDQIAKFHAKGQAKAKAQEAVKLSSVEAENEIYELF